MEFREAERKLSCAEKKESVKLKTERDALSMSSVNRKTNEAPICGIFRKDGLLSALQED